MKKIFISLAVAMMTAVASNAQLIIGGSLEIGGSSNSQKYDGDLTDKGPGSFNFGIAPRVGYLMMDEKLEIGGQLDFKYNRDNKEFEVVNNKAKKDLVSERYYYIGVAPYAKYNFFEKNGFALGVRGTVSLGSNIDVADKYFEVEDIRTQEEADELNETEKEYVKNTGNFAWELSVAPVLTYKPIEHLYLEMVVTGFGFYVNGDIDTIDNGTAKTKYRSTNANLGLNTGSYLRFGIAYIF